MHIHWHVWSSKFSAQLKSAQVSPLYKATDRLTEGTFRPVSVLPRVAKFYEQLYHDQMYNYFMCISWSYLSVFRSLYGCHNVLIKLIEDWKFALDRCQNAGSILMDLSKAFDCLPHMLLLFNKSHACGVSNKPCELMRNFLMGRQGCVERGILKSDWCELRKVVPQGSVLEPFIFNFL